MPLTFNNKNRPRCKVEHNGIEEGEKSSKYFFRIEKSLVNSSFNSHGVKVFSQPEIEQAHFDFYCSLYSKEPVNLSLQQTLLSDFLRTFYIVSDLGLIFDHGLILFIVMLPRK